MPSGQTHVKATLVAASGLAVLATYQTVVFGFDSSLGGDSYGMVAGCLLGILISPDLDIAENGNISHRLIRSRGGNIFYYLWAIFWWPYGKLINHRAKISHFPILGTGIRLIYIFTLTAGLFGTLPYLITFYAFWWGVFGLSVADNLHFVMDIVVSEIRSWI